MSENEQKYVKQVFDDNYIAPLGKFVDRFEQSVKQYTNANSALALNSGTSAIHLALKVLNLSPNDMVFVSNFTFIASVNPILYERCEPVFIDCDQSWNLDPMLLELAIKKYGIPKALIVVHLYGQSAKMDEICQICDYYKIPIIEDAAEALGAKFGDKFLGTIGRMGVFSFNGNKIITTGGGGMLVGGREEIDFARFLSTQAREKEIFYEHKFVGYNYRLSNVLGAIGVGQMEVLEQRVFKKRHLFNKYRSLLPDFEFMPEVSNSYGNRWLTTMLFEDKDLNYKVINALASFGIESRPLWKPMNLQPLFKGYKCITNGVSSDYFARGICLPSGTCLDDEELFNISKIIKESI